MSHWIIAFVVVVLCAGLLGLSGLSGDSLLAARVVFFIVVVGLFAGFVRSLVVSTQSKTLRR